MTNHVHYIAVPATPGSFARMYNNAHMRYSQYFNRRQEQKGHLWQNHFLSCVLDDGHLYQAVKYIETNPVRAGMVDSAESYGWSSARAHVRTCAKITEAFGGQWDDVPIVTKSMCSG